MDSPSDMQIVSLPRGGGNSFELEIPNEKLLYLHELPTALEDVTASIREAIEAPAGFPTLDRAILPEDRIVLAIDPSTPAIETIVAELWRVLEEIGVAVSQVHVLVNVPPAEAEQVRERILGRLDESTRSEIACTIHNPENEGDVGYLASTAGGERIYLAKPLLEADVVIPIGPIGFDPLLGYRGTSSVLYPGLSDASAITRFTGQTHAELTPDNSRPLRQFVDEVGWLLGTQFVVQTLPSGHAHPAHVLAGLSDEVFRRSRELLANDWTVELRERADLVIVTVGPGGTWDDLAAGLDAAVNLVEDDGRIVVCTTIDVEPGAGLRMVREALEPSDALPSLREHRPGDLLAASSLVRATERARVFVQSGLDDDIAEDLFMLPIHTTDEIQRIVEGAERIVVLPFGNHAYTRQIDEPTAG